ncbi:hypothetical protein ACFSUF_21310 [Paenibacillus gansuensis]|uniref:Organic hydroperoxide resistance protein n=2 Tax=Paenibacillus gansuensis TaxID=306542 RepID=A0ABW5PJQ3_9BACL
MRLKGIKSEGVTIVSNYALGKDATEGYVLALNLDITIKGVERNVVEEIVAEAHNVCPYAKATRGNIEVISNVIG